MSAAALWTCTPQSQAISRSPAAERRSSWNRAPTWKASFRGPLPTDAIDARTVNFVSGIQAQWQQNGFDRHAVAGQRRHHARVIHAVRPVFVRGISRSAYDGSGGTLIEVVNPPPPPRHHRRHDHARMAATAITKSTISATTPSRRPMRYTQTATTVAGRGPRRLRRHRHHRHAAAQRPYGRDSKSTTSAITTSPPLFPWARSDKEWAVAGFGDFSGNPGETDMRMRNSNTGKVRGLRHQQQYHHQMRRQWVRSGSEWQVAGFGDFSTPSRRNRRYADAQQQHRSNSKSTTSPTNTIT